MLRRRHGGRWRGNSAHAVAHARALVSPALELRLGVRPGQAVLDLAGYARGRPSSAPALAPGWHGRSARRCLPDLVGVGVDRAQTSGAVEVRDRVASASAMLRPRCRAPGRAVLSIDATRMACRAASGSGATRDFAAELPVEAGLAVAVAWPFYLGGPAPRRRAAPGWRAPPACRPWYQPASELLDVASLQVRWMRRLFCMASSVNT